MKTFLDVLKWAEVVSFNPIFLITSSEYYLLQQIEKILVNRFYDGAAKDFNYNILYGSEVSGSDIATMASSFPMMADRRVVIVREADKVQRDKSFLGGYFSNPSETTLLILLGTKVNRKTLPWKNVPSKYSIDIPLAYENHVRQWLPSLAAKVKLKMNEEAIEYVVSTMGTNLSFIAAEFEKMSMALDDDDRNLTIERMGELTGIRKEWSSWELKDALIQGNLEKCQLIVTHMLQAGENPVGIVASLTFAFKSMWQKAFDLAVNKNMPAPQAYRDRLEFEQIKKMGSKASRKIEYAIEKLLDLDAGLKGFSPFSPEILLSTFVTEVCQYEARES